MTFYAENINGHSFLGRRSCYAGNIYLDGKLEELNGYDIVDVLPRDFRGIARRNLVQQVEVVFIDGTRHDAIAYTWMDLNSVFHGLVCAKDDKEANEYALKKFNERAEHI